MVNEADGDCLRIRDSAGLNGTIVGCLPTGMVVTFLEGPVAVASAAGTATTVMPAGRQRWCPAGPTAGEYGGWVACGFG